MCLLRWWCSNQRQFATGSKAGKSGPKPVVAQGKSPVIVPGDNMAGLVCGHKAATYFITVLDQPAPCENTLSRDANNMGKSVATNKTQAPGDTMMTAVFYLNWQSLQLIYIK